MHRLSLFLIVKLAPPPRPCHQQGAQGHVCCHRPLPRHAAAQAAGVELARVWKLGRASPADALSQRMQKVWNWLGCGTGVGEGLPKLLSLGFPRHTAAQANGIGRISSTYMIIGPADNDMRFGPPQCIMFPSAYDHSPSLPAGSVALLGPAFGLPHHRTSAGETGSPAHCTVTHHAGDSAGVGRGVGGEGGISLICFGRPLAWRER